MRCISSRAVIWRLSAPLFTQMTSQGVNVGLVQTFNHLNRHYQTILGLDVGRNRVDRRFDVVRCRIGDELIQSRDIGSVQAGHDARIGNSDQQTPAGGIRQSRQFRCNRISTGEVALELMLAVFTACQDFKKLGQCHALHRSPLRSRLTVPESARACSSTALRRWRRVARSSWSRSP